MNLFRWAHKWSARVSEWVSEWANERVNNRWWLHSFSIKINGQLNWLSHQQLLQRQVAVAVVDVARTTTTTTTAHWGSIQISNLSLSLWLTDSALSKKHWSTQKEQQHTGTHWATLSTTQTHTHNSQFSTSAHSSQQNCAHTEKVNRTPERHNKKAAAAADAKTQIFRRRRQQWH